MNIKTSSLKEFQKLAGTIKSNGILSIHDYLKFEHGKITKTVGHAFIQFDCEGITENLLVEEKQLFNLVNGTLSDNIIITKKGKKVTLSDARDNLTFQVPDEAFPIIPEIEGSITELSEEFTKYLKMASYFPLRTETIPSLKSFIMIGNNSICASDGFIAFYGKVKESFTAVIDKETAGAISGMNITGFAQTTNYQFFFSNGVIMGFSTHEMGYTDMRKFFVNRSKKPDFVASSSDLSSFNSLALKSVPKDCSCVMAKGKIKMDNSSYDIQLERPLEYVQMEDEFLYNPEQMNRLLSAIKSDEIEFTNGGKMYYIKSSEGDFDTLIMKLTKAVTTTN